MPSVEWTLVAPVVVPIVVGATMLWFGRRAVTLGSHPARTTWQLFVLLLVLNALDTPGGDLVAPTIGGIVSVVVCFVVYVELRHRLASS